jgi:hypothetical protein
MPAGFENRKVATVDSYVIARAAVGCMPC